MRGYGEYRGVNLDEFYALSGGLMFLGLFMGTMFLMITVLIIFYKQISEGYDDKRRFEILQKVGMSNAEVKQTIHSQILMVFFLPIAVAVLHVVVAFRILVMLLEILNLTNVTLFVTCLLATVAVFFVIYLLVFWLTSRTYCRIVGNHA